ncbi:MAG: hypothetical protein ACREMO_05895 [Gemmatimonadales bacterium]
MIRTIRLARVLREAVETPYRDLVTRTTGAAVRGSIEREIAQASAPTTLLDFTSVGLVDFSCADEVVAKLLLGAPADEDHYVVLLGLTEDHSEAIDHVLSHHRLAILVLGSEDTDGSPQVLGALRPDLREALACVHRSGPGDASTVAADLEWPVERAADALQALGLLRLVQVKGGTFRPIPKQ